MNRRQAYQSDFYVLFSDVPPHPSTIVVEPKPSRYRMVTPEGWRVAANGQEYFCVHLVANVQLSPGAGVKSVYIVARVCGLLSFDEENEIISKVFGFLQRTFSEDLSPVKWLF